MQSKLLLVLSILCLLSCKKDKSFDKNIINLLKEIDSLHSRLDTHLNNNKLEDPEFKLLKLTAN